MSSQDDRFSNNNQDKDLSEEREKAIQVLMESTQHRIKDKAYSQKLLADLDELLGNTESELAENYGLLRSDLNRVFDNDLISIYDYLKHRNLVINLVTDAQLKSNLRKVYSDIDSFLFPLLKLSQIGEIIS